MGRGCCRHRTTAEGREVALREAVRGRVFKGEDLGEGDRRRISSGSHPREGTALTSSRRAEGSNDHRA